MPKTLTAWRAVGPRVGPPHDFWRGPAASAMVKHGPWIRGWPVVILVISAAMVVVMVVVGVVAVDAVAGLVVHIGAVEAVPISSPL